MWIDPHVTGLFEGQCAQFCGPQHAKMLLRVYVDTPEKFQQWVADEQASQQSGTHAESATDEQPNPGNSAGTQSSSSGGSAIPPNAPPTRGEVALVAQGNSFAVTPQQGRR